MIEEFKKIIDANLSKEVGERLSKRLQFCDELEVSTSQQKDQIQKLQVTVKELQQEILNYQKFDTRNAELDARDAALKEQARNLKIAELEYQLASEKEKTGFSKEVAMGLVRNTEYRKSVFDSENQGGYNDSTGRWIQPGGTTKTVTETKTQE